MLLYGRSKINIINHNEQDNISYLLKKIIVGDNNILCVNAATIFSLTNFTSENDKDLISYQLEPIINNILGYELFWDIGLPKGVAEFFVSGAAYSPEAVSRLDVSISVGHISKQLSVFGDRVWTESGISDPKLFNQISINYTNAFGGPGYALNPLGKGFVSNVSSETSLPNIELPGQLIVSKTDTPKMAAGFEPYHPSWPQRNFSGMTNVRAPIIKLKNEVMPIHLNAAPIDQRFSGFFYGDEKIEIKNMHPKKSVINSTLPSLRFRAFAVQQNTVGPDMFVEMVTAADTLWLLPNMECGILVFRATCPISSIEADEIKYIYCVMENLKDSPKPVEYYMQSVLAKSQINHDTQKSSEKFVLNYTSINKMAKNIDQTHLNSNNPYENVDTQSNDATKDFLKQPIDEEELILELIRNAEKGIISNKPGLNEQYKEILVKINEMITQFKMTESGTKEFMEERKKAGLSPYPSEEEIIDSFKEVWEQDPKMEASLREKMMALKDFRLKMLERVRIYSERNT